LAASMRLAKYDAIVTMDSDQENKPKWILTLARMLSEFDVVVASRPSLPRISEGLRHGLWEASRRAGRSVELSCVSKKHRAPDHSDWKRDVRSKFLVRAHKLGLRIGEIVVEPQRRGLRPRIGNTVTANLRILMASANEPNQLTILGVTGE
jgi:hypothetical protein